jgi:hypothetical protein
MVQSKSILEHFPATNALTQVAKGVNEELNKSAGDAWYVNLPIWLALAPFFMLGLIPTLLADSVYHLHTIFDLSWSNIMSVLTTIRNETPEGIKKIGMTLGAAALSITALNLITGSVFAVLFILKAAIVLVATTYIGLVIKENLPNMRDVAETARENISAFLQRRRTNINNFFSIFTFRIRNETGVPLVAGNEPAAPPTYTYFPNMPSRTDIYNNLPSNPLAWCFKRSTATETEAPRLSGLGASSNPNPSSGSNSPRINPNPT